MRDTRKRDEKEQVWPPTLTVDSAKGPVLWALLAMCATCAGLIAYRWSQGTPDPVVSAVLLAGVVWALAVATARGDAARFFLTASPYFVAVLALSTLAVLQVIGDPLDERHTNTLLGAYLTLPVAYLLFFLLRRPKEALVGAGITAVLAVALQAGLPTAVAGRVTSGGWVALLTGAFHGALLLLLFSVVRLRSDRELLNAVLQSSRDAVMLLALDRATGSRAVRGASDPAAALQVVLANSAAVRAFGVGAGDRLSASSWTDAAELHAALERALRQGAELSMSAALTNFAGHGWFRVTATPFRGGLAVTFADISDVKAEERRALTLAHTDPLTALPNRRGFEAEAAHRQEMADTAGTPVTVCYLDLDGFKAVNDTHGHDAGDEVLRQVAGRLRSAVRAFDLVARVGGDEFVILVSGLEDAHVEAFFGRVVAAFHRPFEVEGHRLALGASLGVAVGWQDVQVGLDAADEAMYRAKQRGGGVEVTRAGHQLVTPGA